VGGPADSPFLGVGSFSRAVFFLGRRISRAAHFYGTARSIRQNRISPSRVVVLILGLRSITRYPIAHFVWWPR
jgi:hypothetical protein